MWIFRWKKEMMCRFTDFLHPSESDVGCSVLLGESLSVRLVDRGRCLAVRIFANFADKLTANLGPSWINRGLIFLWLTRVKPIKILWTFLGFYALHFLTLSGLLCWFAGVAKFAKYTCIISTTLINATESVTGMICRRKNWTYLEVRVAQVLCYLRLSVPVTSNSKGTTPRKLPVSCSIPHRLSRFKSLNLLRELNSRGSTPSGLPF